MKCIFIGNPLLESESKELKTEIHFSAADNKAQKTLLNGLYLKYKTDLKVISINRKNRQKEIKSLENGCSCTFVKCNEKNKIFYYLSIMKNILIEFIKIIKEYENEQIIVITWGPNIFYSLGALLFKNKIIFVPFIVTSVEYPEYKHLFSLISDFNKLIMKKADGVITYVKNSAIDYTNKPFLKTYYTLNDFQINYAKNNLLKTKKRNKIIIGYSGQLSLVNGIDLLLKVGERLPDNYLLRLCGKGPLEYLVKEYVARYPQKIEYLGLLNVEEVTKFQFNCDVLIVLRPVFDKVTEYYSKYAFSAKLIEYILSGNTVITNDIPCLDLDLKELLTIIPNCNEETIYNAIINFKTDFNKGKKNKEYAIKNFNETMQNNKICSFLDDMLREETK